MNDEEISTARKILKFEAFTSLLIVGIVWGLGINLGKKFIAENPEVTSYMFIAAVIMIAIVFTNKAVRKWNKAINSTGDEIKEIFEEIFEEKRNNDQK